jgi:hypothetical protein
MLDTARGEAVNVTLTHEGNNVREFYFTLPRPVCVGIRLWILLRDQIEFNEFCRRGQMQQRSGDACAGMPGMRYGAKSHRLID